MGDRTLARELTLPAATALVVGQVIAVGIFLTPGTIIRALVAPAWMLAVWAVIGGMAVCGALCYGALAARWPQAGGGYVYLRETYGPQLAFLYGWKCFLIMDPGITAALAVGAATYTAYLVPLGPGGVRLAAITFIGVFAAVHVIGVRVGTRVLTILALLKIALIAVLVVAAFASAAGRWTHFVPFAVRPPSAPPIGVALAGALVSAFFAFGGWWEVTKIAGEVRDPARTLPRALWLGLTAVTVVYALTTFAFVYAVPVDAVQAGEAFVAQVGSAVFGPAGGTVVAGIVVVCVLGSLGTMMMFAPRLYVAMAADGLFPAGAGAVHPRFGTPARAILIQAALASVLVVLGSFDSIVAYFVFITVVFIAMTVAAVLFAGHRDPSLRSPGHPWPAIAFLAMVAGLLLLLALNNPLQATLGIAIVSVGIPAYHAIARRHPRRAAPLEETP
jgi:APA family basic amino acid/polyamine antiporter